MSDDRNTGLQQAPAAAPGGRVGRDLWPRLISGVVLAAGVLAITLAGAIPFSILMGAVGGIVAWEWGRIVRGVDVDLIMTAHIGAVLAAVLLAIMALPGLSLLAIAIGIILVALLSFGRNGVLSATGVAYAALPAVALIWLRFDELYGAYAVLFVILVVAAADTAAYFSGRLIGGPKLWPQVSPNKTWAGFIGAVVAGGLAGLLFGVWLTGASPRWLAMLGAGLAVVAQAGDLAESALKRKFGAKDASSLIPGHGGFMDRADGVIAAGLAAAVIAALLNVHQPAQALLLAKF
jgi:phosphatidate cytidylyltransferase